MNNEKILEDFFRALRVSLTNAFSYSKDHPYFIKSVENFKVKLEETLTVFNPFKIGVTSTGLAVEGRVLTKSGFYDELAGQLHQRKIKSIQIRSGFTLQELVWFLSVISLSPKEIIKGAGINNILKNNPLEHFTIEELDYSEFLHGHGQECNDVWGYMLKDAAQSRDAEKLGILADGFGPLIRRSSQKDILESEDIPASIAEFLVSLKEKNKEKFDKCSKDVFLWLLHNKQSFKENELDKLKPVFKSLNQEDFTSILWEGIVSEDNFDSLSLKIFSKISDQAVQPKINEGLLNKISQPAAIKSDLRAAKRVQDLLTGSGGDNLSPVYRNILESLVKGISSSGVLSFDQKALHENYRYILLNLLSADREQDNLKAAAEALVKELPVIFNEQDFAFLKSLRGLLDKRTQERLRAFIEIENKLSLFIEEAVLNQSLAAGQEFLLDYVSLPSKRAGDYLDKIFSSAAADYRILNLFFRLFPGQLDSFTQRLGQKFQDLDYLYSLIDSLGRLVAPESLSVLEYIYSSANELIKSEVLKAMRKFKKVDVYFLIRQLNTNSFLLRKLLLSVLALDERGVEEGLDLLLKIPSPWGSKNKLLIENVQIVSDLRIPEAVERIRELSGRRFFWNRGLRDKAKKVLGEWNEL